MPTEPIVIGLHALDTEVEVHVCGDDAPQIAQDLRARWHLTLLPEEGVGDEARAQRPVVQVTLGHPKESADPIPHLVADPNRHRLLQLTTQEITRALIDQGRGTLLMLHAAALSNPQTGATAIFVAAGNTGKTTLCHTLAPLLDLAYVTDETVAIRRDGSIAPYPKPLSMRIPGQAHKDERAPKDVGLEAPTLPCWVAGVVLLRRSDDHEGPIQTEALETLTAVTAISSETSAFMDTERPLHWLAEVLESTGGATAVSYREVRDLAPLVAQICDRESPW